MGGLQLEAATKAVSGKHGPMSDTQVDISVNPIVRGIIVLHIQWNDKGETYVSDLSLTSEPRAENIILLWGLCLGAIIALGSARPSRQSLSIKVAEPVDGPRRNGITEARELTTAEQVLAQDVTAAANRAADIYRRSTFLLAGGILMAFVGVSVFAVTLPTGYLLDQERLAFEIQRLGYQLSERQGLAESDQARIEELKRVIQAAQQSQSRPNFYYILARGLRPFGMLIFVEGIAWFLLRQYRSLIEDYKVFVRIQLKRSNYLIALKATSTIQTGSPVADVIRAMLDEDLTGRLSKDQTTESLETIKNNRDEAPVLQALKELKDLLKIGPPKN